MCSKRCASLCQVNLPIGSTNVLELPSSNSARLATRSGRSAPSQDGTYPLSDPGLGRASRPPAPWHPTHPSSYERLLATTLATHSAPVPVLPCPLVPSRKRSPCRRNPPQGLSIRAVPSDLGRTIVLGPKPPGPVRKPLLYPSELRGCEERIPLRRERKRSEFLPDAGRRKAPFLGSTTSPNFRKRPAPHKG